jgi:hypothetical protein
MFLNTKLSKRFGDASSVTRVHPQSAQQSIDAQSLEPQSMASTSDSAPVEPPQRQADLLYCNEIEHREVEWLWQDRLAAGTVAVLSGDPGAGKTWVALAIAAALSKGQTPGETSPSHDQAGPPCTTIYASTHHLGSQLIRPRYLSLGGDPARLVLLRGVASSAAPAALGRPLSLDDTSILEDAIQRTGARLLILDPLHSYLASGGRHRAHEAARLFDNLAQLAEKHNCCILLVRHLRRRGRGANTVELSAAVRSEFVVGSSPDAPAFSALVQTKSNLGPLAPSLGFLLAPESDLSHAFNWTGPSALTSGDLQTDRPIGAGLPQRKLAAEWLRQQLAKGSRTQRDIECAAQRDGISVITLRRARLDIGAFSFKGAYNGAWYWELLETYSSTNQSRAETTAQAIENN